METRNISIISLNGKTPRIHPSAFIAPGCRIIGDVEIGPDASIWYNCVIRADFHSISIGARTNIQDGTVVHCDNFGNGGSGFPTIIGNDVLIGHKAMLHGCNLHDRAFVGLSTVIMDGCVIEEDAMLAAGGLLTPGKLIPSRQLWSGSPAKFMRHLDGAAIVELRRSVERYLINSKIHKDGG